MKKKLVLTMAILLSVVSFQSRAAVSCDEILDDVPGFARSFTGFQENQTKLSVPDELVFKNHQETMVSSWNKITNKIDSLNREIRDLELKLSPENKLNRRSFDKRWFAAKGLRRDSTNPYTVKLKALLFMQQEVKKGIDGLLGSIVDVGEIQKIQLESLTPDNQIVLTWLIKRLNSKFDEIVSYMLDSNLDAQKSNNSNSYQNSNDYNPNKEIEKQYLKLAKEMAIIKTNLDDFLTELKTPKTGTSPFLLQIQRETKSSISDNNRVNVESFLNREIKSSYVSRLAQLDSLKTQKEVSLVDLFRKIDREAMVKIRRNDVEGILDHYVVLLATIAYDYKIPTEQIIEYFDKVYQLGKQGRQEFFIDDSGVTLLTSFALKNMTTNPEFVVDKFFEVVEIWKSEKYKNLKFNDEDLAEMAIVSIKLSLPVESVFERFYEIYNIGRTTREKYHISDFACVDLAQLSFHEKQTAKVPVDNFFFVLDSMAGLNAKWLNDDYSVLRVLTLAQQIQVPVGRVVTAAVEFQREVPDASPAEVIGFLENALLTKLRVVGSFATSSSLLTATEKNESKLMLWDRRHSSDTEWLARVNEQRRNEEAQRRASSSSGSSSIYQSDDTFSVTQYAITGNIINFDNNPFTPW
jgi:hypothetical protein